MNKDMTWSPRSLSALDSDRETLGIGNSIHVNAGTFHNYTFASFCLISLEVTLSTQVDFCFSNCRASAEEIGSKGAQSRLVSCRKYLMETLKERRLKLFGLG